MSAYRKPEEDFLRGSLCTAILRSFMAHATPTRITNGFAYTYFWFFPSMLSCFPVLHGVSSILGYQLNLRRLTPGKINFGPIYDSVPTSSKLQLLATSLDQIDSGNLGTLFKIRLRPTLTWGLPTRLNSAVPYFLTK